MTELINEDILAMRRNEVANYAKNIELYKALLEKVDGKWDEDLIPLKGLPHHEAAGQCPIDRLPRLAVLQQYEHFSYLIRTETIEYLKSSAILAVLEAQASI